MLKIKDNVDLKELKKYGFCEIDEFGIINYLFYKTPFNLRVSSYKIIMLEHEEIDTLYGEVDDIILQKLYDLIKADLVEKVESEE